MGRANAWRQAKAGGFDGRVRVEEGFIELSPASGAVVAVWEKV